MKVQSPLGLRLISGILILYVRLALPSVGSIAAGYAPGTVPIC